jgi:hypothetical protein
VISGLQTVLVVGSAAVLTDIYFESQRQQERASDHAQCTLQHRTHARVPINCNRAGHLLQLQIRRTMPHTARLYLNFPEKEKGCKNWDVLVLVYSSSPFLYQPYTLMDLK